MRFLENGTEIAIGLDELHMIHRHLNQFQILIEELESRAQADALDDQLTNSWIRLKRFLESEELPGSEVEELEDGRYCCQWRDSLTSLTPGRVQGCHQYNAWYVFAWAACTSAAVARGADATMIGGECGKMPGCPENRP